MTENLKQQAAIEFEKECERIILSWTKDLREWHKYAIEALQFASCAGLGVNPVKYNRLFKTESNGINANVVAVLANNLERRTPDQMGISAYQWIDILELNDRVGQHWESLCGPKREEIYNKMKLLINTPAANGGNIITQN